MTRRLSSDAVRFRETLVDALWGDNGSYINEDTFVGACPLCGGAVGVHFAGWASRASLRCHGGCSEAELATAIGLEVRP